MTEDIKAVKTISDAIVRAVSNLSGSANYNESDEYSRSEIDNKFATITYVQQQVKKVNQQVISVSNEVESLDDKIDVLTEMVQNGIEDILEAIAGLSPQPTSQDHVITTYSHTQLQVNEITTEVVTIAYNN